MQGNRATDRHKILCIDDEIENLKILTHVFKDHYQVIACKSGETGLQKALESRPDLILLDVIMPDINGFDLIQKIKAVPDLKDIPVIFITGLQAPLDEEKGLLLGACDYISKPFNFSVARARVNTQLELLRQRRLLEQIANFDALTELPNRHKWQSDMTTLWDCALHTPMNVVVGVVDVDCFKLYNDRYGHQQGDLVLRKVAKAIERVLFEYDGRIYRCGGEEFYFYFPTSSCPEVSQALENCRAAVMRLEIRHEVSAVHDFVTVSIGAVQYHPSPDDGVETAIEMADRQLYEVKQGSRNGYSFTRAQGPGPSL